MTERIFTDSIAVRAEVPLFVGLVGPSGGGKTYSALRLATGIQQVTGGDIFYIDTEANRAKHYAELFKFRHIPFTAPFSPDDYLAVIRHCQAKGAKIVCVDSMSHEHEGPGGVLEMHDKNALRMAKGDENKTEQYNFPAWAEPKAQRRGLINALLQMQMHFVTCFRAKEKLKMVKIKQENGFMKNTPVPQGWQPIAGDEYVYEMTLNCLLPPGCNGVPVWAPEEKAEAQMIKLPQQFRAMFRDNPVLSESIGRKLAEWAKGGAVTPDAPPPAEKAPPTVQATPVAPAPQTPPAAPQSGQGLPPAEYLALLSSVHSAPFLDDLKLAGKAIAAVKHRLNEDQHTQLAETYAEVQKSLTPATRPA